MSDELPTHQKAPGTEFEDLREREVETDFEILVRGKSFKVHQQVLIKHSEYFRTLLTNDDSTEKRQGLIRLDNLTQDAIEICIEYFYTGNINVDAGDTRELLTVAELFQLPEVQDQCFEGLEKGLTVSNCVSVYVLAKEKGQTLLADKSEDVFKASFNHKAIDDFLRFSKQEMEKFLENSLLENDVIWVAIREWIQHDNERRKDDLEDLVALMDWEVFPSGSLLSELWKSSLFMSSEMCKAQVFRSIFMDLERLEENLTVENYFAIHKISTQFMFLTKHAKEFLSDYLSVNAIALYKKSEFTLLNEKQFLQLYRDKCFRYLIPEEWRWTIAMKWIEHDCQRRGVLSRILPTFQFDRMAELFLENRAMNELEEQPGACTALLRTMAMSINKKQQMGLALQFSDGRLCIYNTTSGSWQQPVDEYQIDEKRKLKGKEVWFHLTKGKWKNLETAKCLHLTGTENKQNEDLKVKAMLQSEADIPCLFDGSYNHVFVVGASIVGLSRTTHSNSRPKYETWSFCIFNRDTKQWEKEVWSKHFPVYDGEFIVIENFMYIIGRVWKDITTRSYDSYSSVIWLRPKNGKFQEEGLKALPFPIQENNRCYRDSDAEKWPLNVNNQLVIATSYNFVFVFNDVCKDWMRLPKPPQSEAVHTTGAYSFDLLE